jgi:CRISPR-associated protein Csb2
LGAVFGPSEGAREWRSLTPFVAPRFLKKSGRNTLAGQVTAELASRDLPAPADVRLLDPKGDPSLLRHRHFVRKRGRGPQPPADFGYSLEIRFNAPVNGPICLGYGSHFGLGIFAATEG